VRARHMRTKSVEEGYGIGKNNAEIASFTTLGMTSVRG